MDTDKNDSVVLILRGKKCNFYIEQVSSGKNSNLLFNLVLFFGNLKSNLKSLQTPPMCRMLRWQPYLY